MHSCTFFHVWTGFGNYVTDHQLGIFFKRLVKYRINLMGKKISIEWKINCGQASAQPDEGPRFCVCPHMCKPNHLSPIIFLKTGIKRRPDPNPLLTTPNPNKPKVKTQI